jgi:phospholipid/cholesterol/gamma-HCH transport system permease protein
VACLRGLQAERDSTAVGVAATRSVVNAVFLVVAADGAFAVVYYVLGI